MQDVASPKDETWNQVVRLNNPEHRERLARVEAAMAMRTGGAKVPRAAVLAAVVEKGLQAIEAELGIKRRR
jgi:hypothetical protein